MLVVGGYRDRVQRELSDVSERAYVGMVFRPADLTGLQIDQGRAILAVRVAADHLDSGAQLVVVLLRRDVVVEAARRACTDHSSTDLIDAVLIKASVELRGIWRADVSFIESAVSAILTGRLHRLIALD